MTGYMDDVFLHRTENPLQHVVEVDTDVGGHTAALLDIAFPRGVVPITARGDVGKVHVVDLVLRSFEHFLAKLYDGGMQAQLEDGVGFVSGLALYLFQRVDVPRAQHHGLLADDIASQAQPIAGMGIMEIVGRADREVVDIGSLGLDEVVVAVEEFLLGKEGRMGEIAVDDTYGVVFVVGCYKIVARLFDGFEVAWSNITSESYEHKVFHLFLLMLLIQVVRLSVQYGTMRWKVCLYLVLSSTE